MSNSDLFYLNLGAEFLFQNLQVLWNTQGLVLNEQQWNKCK